MWSIDMWQGDVKWRELWKTHGINIWKTFDETGKPYLRTVKSGCISKNYVSEQNGLPLYKEAVLLL